MTGTARQETVLRILFLKQGRGSGTLAVSVAGHDALHQALNVPAILNELDRQPVQQFGMTGKFSLSAKVRACLLYTSDAADE